MYSEFYHFKKRPFHITPDPEFLFLSPSHKEALASLVYGIEHRKGFIAITGEVGTGKTTILRSYLETADPERLKVVYVFNSDVSFSALLKLIFGELDLPVESDDVFEMVNQLHHFLIEEYKNDRNVVLIVDEAQNMPVKTLESLRMLSNLETSKDKLIQIMLMGQPEFDRILGLEELRQLRQRIAIRCTIKPLSVEESYAYIQHRLMKASTHYQVIFSKKVLKLIVNQAAGIPRIINVLCDNALITGYGLQKKTIDTKIVREVISDFSGRHTRKIRKWLLWPLAIACLLVVAAASLLSPADLASIKRTLHLGAVSETVPAGGKPDIQQAPAPVSAPVLPEPATVQAVAVPTQEEKRPEPVAVETPAPVAKIEVQPEETPAPAAPEPPPPAEIVKPLESAPPPPAPAVAEAPAGPKTSSVTRVVQKGDRLSTLILSIYGRINPSILEAVQQSNPQITNPNRIQSGDEIVFPNVGKAAGKAE